MYPLAISRQERFRCLQAAVWFLWRSPGSSGAASVGAGFCEWAHVMQSWGERVHHALRHLSHATGGGDGTLQRTVERALCVYRLRAPTVTPVAFPVTQWKVKRLLVGGWHHRAGVVAAGQRRSKYVKKPILTNFEDLIRQVPKMAGLSTRIRLWGNNPLYKYFFAFRVFMFT